MQIEKLSVQVPHNKINCRSSTTYMSPDSVETPVESGTYSAESDYSPSEESKSKKKRNMLEKKSKKIKKSYNKKSSKKNDKKHLEILTRKIVKNFGKAIAAFAASTNAKDSVLMYVNNDMAKYKSFQ